MGEKLPFKAEIRPPFTVLVAPLDWGLGHASRCVPVIYECLNAGCEVIIAAAGAQKVLLQAEFPHLSFLEIPGYGLQFGKTRWRTIIKIIAQAPKILIKIKRENRWLAQLTKHKHLDLVISDNRFGMYHHSLQSVFITHQLLIKTPFGKLADRLLQKINYHFINRFNHCWVPDAATGNNLADELSHPTVLPKRNTVYLGPLSRIRPMEPSPGQQLLVLLSGPEPQRSLLEQKLLPQLSRQSMRCTVIRGLPGDTGVPPYRSDNTVMLNHAGTELMRQFIRDAAIVISRSGYSSVMDLLPSGKKCIFFPTPGQTEQEYLATSLQNRGWCCKASQDNFDLPGLLKEAADLRLPDLSRMVDESLLRKAVYDVLKDLNNRGVAAM